MRLSFYATSKPSPEYLSRLKVAARSVYPRGVTLYTATDFTNADLVLDASDTDEEMIAMFEYNASLVPWPGHDAETLYFDIESHNAEKRWDMPVHEFVRTVQWAWGIDGETCFSTNVDDLYEQISGAYGLVAHNGHPFDFSVLLGDEALEWARKGRLFDTFVFGNLANPAPHMFIDREGRKHFDALKPGKVMKWLSLDNQAFQLGIPGKMGNLEELAKRYNPPKTKLEDLDFGLIPTDDEDFVAYARQDIPALQGITFELLKRKKLDDYDWREQLVAAINAQMTRNGVVVDVKAAQERVDELAAVKEELLDHLRVEYDFPTDGAMPWRTNAGKSAIMKLLADHGITEASRPNWTRTATGNLSLGGDVILELTQDTPLAGLGEALSVLMGQRALAHQALACVHSDGLAHPQVSSLQRSGRFSVTQPSLTVWSARGDKAVEKRYFVAEPGCKLLEFDYSAADARAVAAMSGDAAFAKRFEPGVDAHDVSGELFYGHDVYHANREELRPIAKAATHALGYRVGAKRLAEVLDVPLETSKGFIERYRIAYPRVASWQDRVTFEGERGFVVNPWGRKMKVDTDRAFTQSAGLLGQSFTREVLVDGLIAMMNVDPRLMNWVRFTVHDAVVLSVPEEEVEYATRVVTECLSASVHPTGGQEMSFPVEHGLAADSWDQCAH